MTSPDQELTAPSTANYHEQKPLAIIALAAAMLLISSANVLARNKWPGVDWVLPDEHRLFLNGGGQATIDKSGHGTGIPEGDVEFDKTSSVLPSSLFDITSSPLLGP